MQTAGAGRGSATTADADARRSSRFATAATSYARH